MTGISEVRNYRFEFGIPKQEADYYKDALISAYTKAIGKAEVFCKSTKFLSTKSVSIVNQMGTLFSSKGSARDSKDNDLVVLMENIDIQKVEVSATIDVVFTTDCKDSVD